MNLYDAVVPVLSKMLRNLDACIGKAITNAEQRKFDPEVLVQARLAPDQFAFARQVQGACDHAKFIAAKLTGQTPPSHPDTEKTIPELRARIANVISYLEGFKREDFQGGIDRPVTFAHWQGKTMRGGDYLDHHGLPNFYFHYTTAYAILRHNGVDVGKQDFLGKRPFIES
jgi:uncharacterized protein